jgi:hypothetical protein
MREMDLDIVSFGTGAFSSSLHLHFDVEWPASLVAAPRPLLVTLIGINRYWLKEPGLRQKADTYEYHQTGDGEQHKTT